MNGQTPVTSFSYNARGQLLTVTDPVGKVTLNAYDATHGNLLSVTEDEGAGKLNLLSQLGYANPVIGNVTSTTDPCGLVTAMAYDGERRVTQTTSPAPFSLVTKTTYDADGNVTKLERQTNVAAATWQTTLFSYSVSGKLLTTTDPSGTVTTSQYDLLDRLAQVTHAEGRVTKYTYDDVGRPKSVIDPLGQGEVTYAYTPNGRVLIRAGRLCELSEIGFRAEIMDDLRLYSAGI